MSAATPTRSTKLTNTEVNHPAPLLRRPSMGGGRHLTQKTNPTHKHGGNDTANPKRT